MNAWILPLCSKKTKRKRSKWVFIIDFICFMPLHCSSSRSLSLSVCVCVWIWISSINAQRLQLEIEQLALLLSTKMDISPILCTNTLNGSPAISFSFTLSVCPSKALLNPILCERYTVENTKHILMVLIILCCVLNVEYNHPSYAISTHGHTCPVFNDLNGVWHVDVCV